MCYNFRDQMLLKYDEDVFQEVYDAFESLPLTAIVNGEYLAMHGGISSRCLESLDAIN